MPPTPSPAPRGRHASTSTGIWSRCTISEIPAGTGRRISIREFQSVSLENGSAKGAVCKDTIESVRVSAMLQMTQIKGQTLEALCNAIAGAFRKDELAKLLRFKMDLRLDRPVDSDDGTDDLLYNLLTE